MRIFISSLAGKSWGYRRNFGNLGAITALKTFWSSCSQTLSSVQFNMEQKLKYVANTKYFIGQRMKTTLAIAQPTQGLNALTNFNKVRPGVHISHPLLTICNLPNHQNQFSKLSIALAAFNGFWRRLSTIKSLGRVKSFFQAFETSKQPLPSTRVT